MEKIEKPMAFIGFSANTEIIVRIDRLRESEKAPLEEMTCELGGTSSNVAKAMAKMGIPTTLYALTGYNDDFFSHCFRYALKKSPGINTIEFQILEQGNMAFIPIDEVKKVSQVFGSKGKIQPDKIASCIEIIKNDVAENVWRIATGVRSPEVELVKALLGNHRGFRYLNPRVDLIQSKEIFFDLLKQTDVLVINHAEYIACISHKEINSRSDIQKMFGVSLVIVTCDQYGGKFALANDFTDTKRQFDACTDYITDGVEIFPTGAGDWFAGALISCFVKLGKSILEITNEEIIDAVYFASRVAGKKITIRGAGNGPSESEL
jgi:sugar/nucleoside kinase (ribokinase family)